MKVERSFTAQPQGFSGPNHAVIRRFSWSNIASKKYIALIQKDLALDAIQRSLCASQAFKALYARSSVYEGPVGW